MVYVAMTVCLNCESAQLKSAQLTLIKGSAGTHCSTKTLSPGSAATAQLTPCL